MIVDASLVIDAIADPGPRDKAARAALAAQPPTESDVVAALSDAESFESALKLLHGAMCAAAGSCRKPRYVTPTRSTSPPLNGTRPA